MQASPSNLVRRYLVAAVLLCLLAWGGFLRVQALSASPYWMDEGYTINAVLGILEHGTQTLDSGQTYACPMYCYPTAAIAKTFGENAFSYRILAALAGTLFIVVIYFAGAQLFGPVVGLLAAFFATFSYWQIAWSRQARWYTLFEVFIWLAIISFYKAAFSILRPSLAGMNSITLPFS